MADSFANRARKVTLPFALNHLKQLEGLVDGSMNGLGINDTHLAAVRESLTELRELLEEANYGARDIERFERYRTELLHMQNLRRLRETLNDAELSRAWMLFRCGGWHWPPPERHRRKRAALQAEVDELYRAP